MHIDYRKAFCVLSCIMLAIAQNMNAQDNHEGVLQGTIIDTSENPVQYASVSLFDTDSIMVLTVLSDSLGRFEMKNLSLKQGTIHFSHILYNPREIHVDLMQNPLLDTIIMTPKIYGIDKVTVMADFMKPQPNGYVVDLRGNKITKGKTMQETLGLLPGVSTYNGISINGIGGTQIYIDNRKVNNPKELEALLSEYVDHVEVKYNTGSSYDAQERGGVIKITLKEMYQNGFFGSLGGSASVRPKYGLSSENAYLIFRGKYKKVGLYNYGGYSNFKEIARYDISSYYPDSKTALNMITDESGWARNFHDNLSIVYNFTPKHSLGANFSIGLGNSYPKSTSNSITYSDSNNQSSFSEIKSTHKNSLYQTTLDYTWLIDDKGSDLVVKADYLTNRANRKSNYQYDSVENRRDDLTDKTRMFATDVKFTYHLGEQSVLSAGGRYYFLRTERDLLYENREGECWVDNYDLSDNFMVKGDGFAGYLSFSSSVKRFFYEVGLRVQQDNVRHISHKTDDEVNNKYFNFFPNANINYLSANQNFSVNLSYSRNIGYIPYSEISPAVHYETEYSYTKGNPDLTLSIDNIFQFSIMLGKWDVYYDYYYSTNEINYFTFLDNENPLIKYSMPMNTRSSTFHILGFDREVNITKWWDLYCDFYMKNRNISYPESDTIQQYSSTAFFGTITNDFRINDTWGGTISVRGETREKIDDKTMLPVYGVSIDIYKYFFKKKFLVKLSAQPLFSKLRNWEINKRDYISYNRYKTPQTNFRFSLSYNFNSGKNITVKQVESIQSIEERVEKK